MTGTAERPSLDTLRLRPPAGDARQDPGDRLLAGLLRALLIDPDSPAPASIGMAEVATVLWTRFLKYDAADPHWPDRDRFVMAAGGSALLLQALLYLTGHSGISAEDLSQLRSAGSAAVLPCRSHPAVEVSTGSSGQGVATAIGLALAERLTAARFGKSLADHRSWVMCSQEDLAAGVSHEAASLAGHLRLERLTLLLEEGSAPSAAAGSDDVLKRFSAYGWAVRRIDGHDTAQIASALSLALRARKPTLIACRTGTMSGATVPTASGHIPESAAHRWERAGARGAAARRGWLKRMARHPMRMEFERAIAGRLPDGYHEAAADLKATGGDAGAASSTLAASRRVLEAMVAAVPELVGGVCGAGLSDTGSGGTISPGNFAGRQLQFGSRRQAVAAAVNGLALHGGLIPFAAATQGGADEMRAALRQAAALRLRVIHLLTPGADEAADLAGLRALPGVQLFRPADALETAECWDLAMRRTDGPSLLALTGDAFPQQRGDGTENRCARGAYLLRAPGGSRAATLIASGPEIAVAIDAAEALAADGIAVGVVSMPCWELFAAQDDAYRARILGPAPRFAFEAAESFGWERWLGPDGVFVTPGNARACTVDTIVAAVRRKLG